MLFQVLHIVLSVLLAGTLSVHGFRKRSLSISGSIVAFIVGFLHFAVSAKFGVVLILFYYTSSYLTKLKQERKQKLEAHYKIGGQRNAIQVLSNSVLATIVVVLYGYFIEKNDDVSFYFNCL